MVVATFRGRFEDFDAQLDVAEDGSAKLVGTVDPTHDRRQGREPGRPPPVAGLLRHRALPARSLRVDSVRIEGDEAVVDGELTIKGNTQPVQARGAYVGPHEDIAGNTKIGLTLETEVDRTLYGLNWNAPLPKGGFALANEVQLTVELELAKA